jgi:IS30 family transposase
MRPKECRLATHYPLQGIVARKLRSEWSPEHISRWFTVQFFDDERTRVSHEKIYRSLFTQARGVLNNELPAYLRSGRMMRRSKDASTKGQRRAQIVDGISI